jgi:hypothetical protein
MAVFALTQLHLAANEVNMSCFANSVDVSAQSDELDVTTFCGGGYRQKITGLSTFNVNASGFQDYVAPSPGTAFDGSAVLVSPGTTNTFTVAPTGDTVGNVAYFGQSKSTTLTELSGAVGEVAGFTLNTSGTNRLVRGVMLHPVTARTATGNGDAVAFTPPTATQSLHAAFHVHSVTGTGTIEFEIETDDNDDFTTAITRITSAEFSDVGHGFGSLAGALTDETHIRVVYTITGFTSVTFSVAAGVGVA